MSNKLQKDYTSFYHITTFEAYNKILKEGISANSKRIFVSNTSDKAVLLAIALEQLPDIYTTNTEKIVVLKLSQEKNKFEENEIINDNQAAVEWTQPMQNIILRDNIPIDNIELYDTIELGQEPERTKKISDLSLFVERERIKFESKIKS